VLAHAQTIVRDWAVAGALTDRAFRALDQHLARGAQVGDVESVLRKAVAALAERHQEQEKSVEASVPRVEATPDASVQATRREWALEADLAEACARRRAPEEWKGAFEEYARLKERTLLRQA